MFVAAPLVEADKETDERNFLLWRLEKGVAEGSTEIPKGASSLLYLELQLGNGKCGSFFKGLQYSPLSLGTIYRFGTLNLTPKVRVLSDWIACSCFSCISDLEQTKYTRAIVGVQILCTVQEFSLWNFISVH